MLLKNINKVIRFWLALLLLRYFFIEKEAKHILSKID